ncbi:MAG: adenosylcobalamin-dependent ribonucleoside-diphosphate reductase, partial [Halobacteriovoraceae bacterium]|nr:adenosylcobalamin-dependent ribonucleoside-diphosphate reductase [Halobacteriovoraceae bacterium]
KKEAQIFCDELTYMLIHQMAAPNSPQWFNSGLFESYGIKGSPQGHFFVDPKTGSIKKSQSSYERPQPHACFIQGVVDSLVGDRGIMNLWEREARLFKFGSGTGTNFSELRGKGEPLSSGGTSSGLMGWLKIGDTAAGAIKSGGTTRRAAKMVCLDLDHPDVEEFITWKAREEEKLAAMVTGHKLIKELKEKASKGKLSSEDEVEAVKSGVPSGYLNHLKQVSEKQGKLLESEALDTDWTGLGYQSLSGQNANNSVRINNSFMEALQKDKDWDLLNRIDGKVAKKVKAKDLWEKICTSAWLCADPGIQFHTTINSWHTCPAGGEIRASNPCSEYMFLDDTACNLASLNLVKFDKENVFQIEDFIQACSLWTLVLEISVFMAHYPSKEIAKRSFEYRTLGLGFANLGALLMRRGIPYESEEGRNLGAAISSLMGATAYRTSSKMAKSYGPFKHFKENKERFLEILQRHHKESLKIPLEEGILDVANKQWSKAIDGAKKYGLRNAQVSAIAPTGPIGLVMDCDTTGVEPDYSLVKSKNLAGGGAFSLINRSVPQALSSLGYGESERKEIEEFILKENETDGAPHLKSEHYPVFDCAVGKKESRVISVDGHLNMMAAIQPFISGAISKTINLPSNSSVDTVSNVFKKAHELGLKAVAIYRDGSKLSQPLMSQVETPYSQEECPNCGFQKLIPSGTCYKCENCGESTSCT